MIEFAKNFVTCTDEVYRLQRGDDPECKYFQQMAEQGHYGGRPGKTRQGIYVCSANGTFLASINSNSASAVLNTLKKGLAKFAELPAGTRSVFDSEKIKANFRWESYFPENGLALAVYSRDLPVDLEIESERPSRWNRDSAWYFETEMNNLLPRGLKVGDQFEFPGLLSERLLRMNLVDTVRGQTDPFSKGEVDAEIRCTVVSVDSDTVEFTISGQAESDSTDTRDRRTPRGVVTSVNGKANWSYANSKFEQFELVALGYRWGRTRFNGRGRGPNENPLGFVVTLAPKDETPNVPGLLYTYDKAWFLNSGSTKDRTPELNE